VPGATNVNPVGKVETRRTPVAALGPLLVAPNVNLTVSPGRAVPEGTDALAARSASAPNDVLAVLELLAGVGSGVVEVTVAVFWIVAGPE
jgi:hypothetical protein